MTVTDVRKDTESLTMTITAEFGVPIERVWRLWEDPRLLERWWGPPTYPATMIDHDLSPGGKVHYSMTGPGGDTHHGWWRVTAVDAPTRLEFEDGFADENGEPNPDLPTTTTVVTLGETAGGGTRMDLQTRFASIEDMEQILAMGAEEGMRAAMSQMDDLLAA
ncbi:MAG TPA: SRPBCC domain-containing protein [Acidimicrobiia bacterium]|nr:SRPBCC domain-containing protein [Acidimicrobiia bacterium]